MPAKPRRGDVVLLPFPFADLTSTKVRPALVLSSSLYHKSEPDIIVAAITSNVAAHQGPTDYTLQDWRRSGLLAPSVVKVSLATVEPSLVYHRLGRLTDRDLKEVEKRLRLALGPVSRPDTEASGYITPSPLRLL
jgi:mRNA interferase MazF